MIPVETDEGDVEYLPAWLDITAIDDLFILVKVKMLNFKSITHLLLYCFSDSALDIHYTGP